MSTLATIQIKKGKLILRNPDKSRRGAWALEARAVELTDEDGDVELVPFDPEKLEHLLSFAKEQLPATATVTAEKDAQGNPIPNKWRAKDA